jgi:hypothetical protein
MPRAVQFDQFGPVYVLHIAEVPRPVPGDGEACVEVVCAGINPVPIEIGFWHVTCVISDVSLLGRIR